MAARYIIKSGDMYFCGWDQLGNICLRTDKSLAYRMVRQVATTTVPKVEKVTGEASEILSL